MNDAWKNLIPENTVLFLGSGFSLDAKNKTKEHFKAGKDLSTALGKALGYSTEHHVPLDEIAEDFLPDRQRFLYATLQPLMTTTSVSDDQKFIAAKRWKRVYTTNYDDVYEFALLANQKEPETITFDSPEKKQRRNQQVIHLHGSIHDCDETNIDNRLVLSKSSYDRQLSKPRPWFDNFVDDIRFSQAVVFLGYSLSDTPIRALLLADEEVKNRTFFVTRSEPDERYKAFTQKYGTIYPIQTSGFVDHLKSVKIEGRTHANRFSAFVELNPKKDGQDLHSATTVEIRNLLLKGTFLPRTCAAHWPKSGYVLPREAEISNAISSFATARTIVVHSRVGNGKSVFCEMLAIALSEKGYRCIRAKSSAQLSDGDLALLKSTQRLVLFFQNADDAENVLRQMGVNVRPDMRFIVEASSSLADVRANELSKALVNPIYRLDANRLTEADLRHLQGLLSSAGFPINDFEVFFKGCFELRDFLLRLLQNESIRKRVIEQIKPAWDMPTARRAIVSAFALKTFELSISPSLKREILGEDPIASLEGALNEQRHAVLDFFDFRDSSVEPYSAIVAEFLLLELLTPDDLLEWVLRAAKIAARRKQDEVEKGQFGQRFQESKLVLGRVLQFSRLLNLLDNTPSNHAKIKAFYEEARYEPAIDLEPLFWLQFSMVHSGVEADLENLRVALDYIDTAYVRGTSQQKFETYQLDTHRMKLLLRYEIEAKDERETVERWSEISDGFNKLEEMISAPNHRDFVIRVLESVEDFFRSVGNKLQSEQKSEAFSMIDTISRSLENLSDEQKIKSKVEPVRLSLLRSAEYLRRS